MMITVTVMLVLDRGLFRQIDYSLLFTFAGFFIFIGNLTQFDFLNIIRDSFFGSATGTYFSAIAVIGHAKVHFPQPTHLLSSIIGM